MIHKIHSGIWRITVPSQFYTVNPLQEKLLPERESAVYLNKEVCIQYSVFCWKHGNYKKYQT